MQRDTRNPFFALRKPTSPQAKDITDTYMYIAGAYLLLLAAISHAYDNLQGTFDILSPILDVIGRYMPAAYNSLTELSPERAHYVSQVMALNGLLALLLVPALFRYAFRVHLHQNLLVVAKSHIKTLTMPRVARYIRPSKTTYTYAEVRLSRLWSIPLAGFAMLCIGFLAAGRPHPTGKDTWLHDNHSDYFIAFDGIILLGGIFLVFLFFIDIYARVLLYRRADAKRRAQRWRPNATRYIQ